MRTHVAAMVALGAKTMAVLYRAQGEAGESEGEEQFEAATLATTNTLCAAAMHASLSSNGAS